MRRRNLNASNIYQLEMSEALAAAAFERGRAAGAHLAAWMEGVVPL